MGAQEGAFNSVFNNTFIMSNQFVRTLTLRDHEALLVIEKRTFLEFVSEGIVFPRRRTWSEGDCQQFDAIALHNKSLPWLNSENSTESTVSGCGTSDLLSGSDDDTPCEGVNTTVMITRLPSDFTHDKFISMLDMEGFQGCYDPSSFRTSCSWNTAPVEHRIVFINMVRTAVFINTHLQEPQGARNPWKYKGNR